MGKVTEEGKSRSEGFSETDHGTVVRIHVQPRAQTTECVGWHGDALKFRVSAPPVDGLANEALCEYLAKVFKIPKGAVVIYSGQGSRQKRVLLKGITIEQAKQKLFP